MASMATRRLGLGVAVTGGCLYAVGGSDGAAPLASVERYFVILPHTVSLYLNIMFTGLTL